MAYLLKNRALVSGGDAEVAMNLAETLGAHADVQNVFVDVDVSDEELARLAEG